MAAAFQQSGILFSRMHLLNNSEGIEVSVTHTQRIMGLRPSGLQGFLEFIKNSSCTFEIEKESEVTYEEASLVTGKWRTRFSC